VWTTSASVRSPVTTAILKAQQRLGHRDASTTLRNYAHAMPLEDQEVADAIDAFLASRPDQTAD